MTNGHVRLGAEGGRSAGVGRHARRGSRRERRRVWLLAALLLCAPSVASCGGGEQEAAYDPAATAKQIQDAVTAGLPSPKLTVLDTLPHSTDAWTEGLEVSDGQLYEGTGLAGHSELRELDLKTGKLIRATPLPDGLYGEGITVVGSLIWQLTYRDGVLLQWNRETLNAGGRAPWAGEGWGLCHDKDGQLIASDGSNILRIVDRNGADVQDTINVQLRGEPLNGLNELDCVPGRIVANVFGTDWIVGIDPATGRVTSAVNAAKLVPAGVKDDPKRVLNGVAWIPGTDEFLLTGKQWPSMFRVRLKP